MTLAWLTCLLGTMWVRQHNEQERAVCLAVWGPHHGNTSSSQDVLPALCLYQPTALSFSFWWCVSSSVYADAMLELWFWHCFSTNACKSQLKFIIHRVLAVVTFSLPWTKTCLIHFSSPNTASCLIAGFHHSWFSFIAFRAHSNTSLHLTALDFWVTSFSLLQTSCLPPSLSSSPSNLMYCQREETVPCTETSITLSR